MKYLVRIKEELDHVFNSFCRVNDIETNFEGLGWLGAHKGTYLYTATMPPNLATALKLTLPVIIMEKPNERKY